MVGITAFGGYIPRLRLNRAAIAAAHTWLVPGLAGKAKGSRSMANWDEDAITMAVEAARDCLNRPEDERADVDALYLASTTLPFVDRLNSGLVATALNLRKDINALDVTASRRAGATALIQALAAVKSGDTGQALVIASDTPPSRAASTQEMDYGDGAAAVTVGTENIVAEFVGSHTVTMDFVDHFRGDGFKYEYNWEERWIRDEGYSKIVPDAVAGVLEKTGVSADSIDHFILPCTFARLPQTLARKCGIEADKVRDNLAGVCGETGTAHAMLMLAHALQEAKPGQKILMLNFGQGCDALIFETTAALTAAQAGRVGVNGWLKNGKEESNYMKFLIFRDLVDWEKGMRAEQDKKTALTTSYRKEDMVTGLVGGRCTETGVVQYPATRISVNPNNHAVDTQEPYYFSERTAKVLSWSADNLAFSMDPPAHFGMITFAEGGRFLADMTDVELGDVDSGVEMRMVFRIKAFDEQRGFTRYFWKAAPLIISD